MTLDQQHRRSIRFRRPSPAHRLPVGGGHRISTVSRSGAVNHPLLVPLRFYHGTRALAREGLAIHGDINLAPRKPTKFEAQMTTSMDELAKKFNGFESLMS